jgi:hypothetical protein
MSNVGFRPTNAGLTSDQAAAAANREKENAAKFKRPELETGKWYEAQVSGSATFSINPNSGNTQLMVPLTILDSEGEATRISVRHYMTLPWITEPDALKGAGFSPDTQVAAATENGKNFPPKTEFLQAQYVRATRGTEDFPYTSDLSDTAGQEVMDKIDTVFLEAAEQADDEGNTDAFIGDRLFVKVTLEENDSGKTYARVDRIGGAVKTGEELGEI